ncbi:MAG: NUDIX hydrolase [Candidatus Rickettsia vulgarisii]
MDVQKKILEYNSIFPEEMECKEKILQFLDNCQRPFDRETKEGHFTAGSLLLNSDKTKFLVMHHRKLNVWLHLGGHCDGNGDLLSVAIREAQEESGILEIEPLSKEIFDIDIWQIPTSLDEQEHCHYDIKFLLKTVGSDNYIKNEESYDLKWLDLNTDDYGEIILDNDIKRMLKKFRMISEF